MLPVVFSDSQPMCFHRSVFFFLAFVPLLACVPERVAPEPTAKRVAPLDSFSIKSILYGRRELSSLLWVNDSTLVSFDAFDDLYFYRKLGTVFSYAANVKLLPKNHTVGSLSLSQNGRKLYRLREKTIHTYSLDGQLEDSVTISASLPALKDNYFVSSCNFLPFLEFGDTIVCYYSHSDANDFFKTYTEAAFMELIPQKDSVVVKTILKKPAQLKFYDVHYYLFHCAVGRTLYKLYNGLDTIYTHNLVTGAEAAVPIGNKDYLLPEKADLNKLFGPAYRAKRSLSNFAYCGFFHNPITGHFVLFYEQPAQAKPGKNATANDTKLQALVLDPNLKPLRYLDFGKSYFPPMTYIQCPGKGLAMPLTTEHPNDEPIRYHIYNF